jgi:hypothetical protein
MQRKGLRSLFWKRTTTSLNFVGTLYQLLLQAGNADKNLADEGKLGES